MVHLDIKTVLTISVLWLVGMGVSAQSFSYKGIENTYGKFIVPANLNEYKKIEDYLPTNHVKDGSVDYTTYIQKAIDENKNVVFPNFPLLINDSGIQLRDNSNVFFDRNSKLLLKPTDKGRYNMLLLEGIKNVKLYNPTLIGDRKKHKGADGQWGMGLKIKNVQKSEIYNINISDTWGDGMIIVHHGKNNPGNVLVKYGSIDNARRNGIAIISGMNVTIDSLQISNTNGHNPSCGIDVEPDKNALNVVDNVVLRNIFTYNNLKDGIVLNPFNFIKDSKSFTVSILNHKDQYSRYGLGFSNSIKTTKSLPGKIVVKNSEYNDSRIKEAVRISEHAKVFPTISMEGVKTNKIKESNFKQHLQKKLRNSENFLFVQ